MIKSNFFGGVFRIFYIKSAKRDNFTSSFRTMLSRSRESRHPCLVPDFSKIWIMHITVFLPCPNSHHYHHIISINNNSFLFSSRNHPAEWGAVPSNEHRWECLKENWKEHLLGIYHILDRLPGGRSLRKQKPSHNISKCIFFFFIYIFASWFSLLSDFCSNRLCPLSSFSW